MSIRALVESQEQIPEGLTDHYKETEDGKFVLDIEGIDSHPEVHGLKTAYEETKQKRSALSKERDKYKKMADQIPEDIDSETLQQAVERIKNGNKDPELEKLKKTWQEELDKRDSELKQTKQQFNNMVVENNLKSALAANGVTDPVFQEAALNMLSSQIQIQEDDSGNPQPFFEDNMANKLPVNDYVKKWVSGEKGSKFVDPNTGSGAKGGKPAPGNKTEMTRSQFESLSPQEKMKFSTEGGKITNE